MTEHAHVWFQCPFCGAESAHPDDKAKRYCGRCHVFVDDAMARVAEKLKDMTLELDGLLPGQGCVNIAATFGHGDRWTTITVRHASLMSESPDGWDTEIRHGAL